MYYELVSFLVNGYAPYNYGQFKESFIRLKIIVLFVGVACDPAPNIVASLITQVIYGFVILPQVWLNELTAGEVVSKVYSTFENFIILTFISMVFTKIVKNRQKS